MKALLCFLGLHTRKWQPEREINVQGDLTPVQFGVCEKCGHIIIRKIKVQP